LRIRPPRFSVKRALPTLLLVALLINFSLPIAGILIDFANVFTQFFLSKVTSQYTSGTGFTEALANNLSLANVFDASSVQASINQLSVNNSLIFE